MVDGISVSIPTIGHLIDVSDIEFALPHHVIMDILGWVKFGTTYCGWIALMDAGKSFGVGKLGMIGAVVSITFAWIMFGHQIDGVS